VRDCVLLADVFNDFAHDDGERLLRSFRDAVDGVHDLLSWARGRGTPVVFANDAFGHWSDAPAIVERARRGPGGPLVDRIRPASGEPFVVKPRYSAFDHTPLPMLLEQLQVERLLLGGMSTERCVAQTAIDAREEGLKVTVVTSACAAVDPKLAEIALTYLAEVAGVFVAPDARAAVSDVEVVSPT
jgi:nicotinamidase-related amidase